MRQWGVEGRIVPSSDFLTDEDRLIDAIDSRTKMMIVSLVNFLTGQRVDIPKLARACREKGVILVVDAIQAAGNINIDVKALNCHALCFGSPKWMFGPMGVGTIYIEKALIEQFLVPQAGMFSVPDPWNFFNYEQDFIKKCSKFECGCPANLSFYGYAPNLEMFLDLGMENIERYLLDLTGKLHDELTSRGVKVITPREDHRRAAIITFDAASAGWQDGESLRKALEEKGIAVAVRMGFVRVSPHFYNDWSDIEPFLDVIFKRG